jgi:TPR repeat protein
MKLLIMRSTNSINCAVQPDKPKIFRCGFFFLAHLSLLLGLFVSGAAWAQTEALAIELERRATNLNDPEASLQLGLMYRNNAGTFWKMPRAEQVKNAEHWLQHSAKHGKLSLAQHNLGELYRHGEIGALPANEALAAYWYGLAADQGFAESQYNLGLLLATAKTIPQDRSQAVAWYRRAAEQGHISAQLLLGNAYEYGLGVPVNYPEAVRWYRSAADQGNVSAQYALARMLEKELGPEHDPLQAAELRRRADAQQEQQEKVLAESQSRPVTPLVCFAEGAEEQCKEERELQEAASSTNSLKDAVEVVVPLAITGAIIGSITADEPTTSIPPSARLDSCRAEAAKSISTCWVSIEDCDIAGCNNTARCDGDWADASRCNSLLSGRNAELGVFYCDSDLRFVSKDWDLVVENACRD